MMGIVPGEKIRIAAVVQATHDRTAWNQANHD